jgi:membrane protein DedA with SNARE-associated domain
VLALVPAFLVLASVTDKLADWATNVVGDLGLWGVFLLMVPESACIPIPSEATMLFAGFNVSEGKFSLVGAVVVATFANLIGSWIAYAVGYYGRLELLERYPIFHVNPTAMAKTEQWFEKYGSWTVFFARMLPVVRTFVSLPAGVARMPLGRFSVLTVLGALPWNIGLCLAGKAARDNWTDIKDKLHYADYVFAVVIVGLVVWLVVRWWRARDRAAVDAA